ncbi:MAG: DUF1641 domain-containing protein [Burkholderiaceae bacterium]|nr:DUF1641 domain-containing protein [Burkholderiaceae bacterium]
MNTQTGEAHAAAVEVDRVVAAARDALSDEMVSRLSSSAGDALELMDQITRAGLGRAIPAVAEMVNNGDLDRLVKLARVYGSAEDALSDEMVGRLTETIGNGLSLLDRASRGGAERIVAMLEHLEGSGALERLANSVPQLVERLGVVQNLLQSLEHAVNVSAQAPRASGGLSGLWQMMRDPDTQETLSFLLTIGKEMRKTIAQK